MGWFDNILGKVVAMFKTDPLVEAGKRAAAEAERLWSLDVYDPPIGDKRPRAAFCLQVINDIIHKAGWTWIKYLGNGPPQWCGLFAAACWRVAGIDPKWLATFWASTVRLDNWAKGEDWVSEGKRTDAGGPRPFIALNSKSRPADCAFPDGSLPRAGDIVVVGDETPKEGDHICVVISYDPTTGTFVTISGNGGGVGPTGVKREGISRRDYMVGLGAYHVLRVYRPLFTDLKQ